MTHPDLKSRQVQALCPACQQFNQCAMVEDPDSKSCWCMQMQPTVTIQDDGKNNINGKVCFCQACLTKK